MSCNKRILFLIFSCSIFLYLLWCIFSSIQAKSTDRKCKPLTMEKEDLVNSLTSFSYIVSEDERPFLKLNDLVIATIASLDHIGEAMSVGFDHFKNIYLKTNFDSNIALTFCF